MIRVGFVGRKGARNDPFGKDPHQARSSSSSMSSWVHGRGFVRFNPKTGRWVVYENPEPSALNRFQWIDNSTTPPTIWYPDFLTQMFVRIQPLE